ncbi:hypothetical protein Tco_0800315 [Tanacetum coccineum]|uniref:Uncharacterized protein n=1 Tax=Tanacetum coccineum TaxID=301880 RepID=A0ABQ4ZTT2_9ASTR
MYEKVKRANENFIPIGSAKDEKLIKKMNEKAASMDKEEVSKEPESTKVKAKIEEPKENIRKRSGRRLKMKAPKRSKRQKTDSDHEEENQLSTFLKIVLEEEENIDYEFLGTRYPIINWESKFYVYGHFGRELIYYRVFRADGSSRWIKTFSEMIKFFDRMDLVEIHSLVMKRFETTPLEGIDLLLWGDLRIMFESKEDYELCKNQEEWKLQSWIFYKNYGVHILRLEDAVSDDDTVFDLLRFIEQQIDEFGGQDGIQKQTAFGKDKLNPLIVDSLLKTIRLSIHLVVYNEELAIPEQTATEGKLKENQGCRVDTDQVHQNGDLKNRSVWIHPPGLQDWVSDDELEAPDAAPQSLETDIREKDEKSSKKRTKPSTEWKSVKRQSQIKANVQESQSQNKRAMNPTSTWVYTQLGNPLFIYWLSKEDKEIKGQDYKEAQTWWNSHVKVVGAYIRFTLRTTDPEIGCWFGGKLIKKLRQKGVYEESYYKTCCMSWGKLIPTHAYYNGSCISKDTEDPSWSIAWTSSEERSAAIEAHVRTLEAQVATLIAQTTSLQTQLTTALGRIATLEARDPEPQDGPAEAGSSC